VVNVSWANPQFLILICLNFQVRAISSSASLLVGPTAKSPDEQEDGGAAGVDSDTHVSGLPYVEQESMAWLLPAAAAGS
jgi:hypothetical protein